LVVLQLAIVASAGVGEVVEIVALTAARPMVPSPSASPVSASSEARDHTWLAALYDATAEAVYRYSLMLVRDSATAEDVTAETFLRVWRSRQGLRDGNVLSWVLTVTRNCAFDALRARRREIGVSEFSHSEDTTVTVPAKAISDADLAAVRTALRRLTPEQQQVIFLRLYEELPHEAVAARLGRSANAVRAIQFRALSRMHALLEAARA
jgi:RNA polymerase sigma-70 factor (ECF subfamily)